MITALLSRFPWAKPTIIGFVIAGVVALGWYIDNLQKRLELAQQDKRQFASWLHDCQTTNATNLRNIKALEGAIYRIQQVAIANQKQAQEAANKAARRARESEEELAGLQSELDTLRKQEPSCEQIENLDIGDVCPSAVERLRQRANTDN